MRSVLFRVDGNRFIGYGHVIRCVALAQFLKDRFLLSFACIAPDDFVISQFRDLGEIISIRNTFYEEGRNKLEGNLLYDLEPLESNFDVVVLDGYFFSDQYITRIKAAGKQVIYIDDQYRSGLNCDLLINHLPDADIRDNVYVDARIKLLGTDYALIRKEFSEFVCTTKQNASEKLFIALGGTATSAIIENIIQSIKRIGKNFQILVLTSAKVRGANLTFHGLQPQEIALKICDSDICLITPGMISYEVFSIGKPVVMGALNDGQSHILKTFEDKGLCYNIGFWSNINTISLKAALKECIGKSGNQKIRFDGKSGERIVNAFFTL